MEETEDFQKYLTPVQKKVALMTGKMPLMPPKGSEPVDQSPAPVPTECGQLMAYIAERQAVGLLKREQITEAYAKSGVSVTDILPPNDPETIKERVFLVYSALKEMCDV
jgi:hypothetical protein